MPDLDEPGTETFSVPFVQRLLFTSDVLGAERHVLARVLEPSGELAPKVQFWIDRHVTSARPELLDDVQEFLDERADELRPAGIHVAVGGEAVKNDWAHVERFLEAINDADLDRRSYIVVIGGGAVLDAVGFAAATAHRGIRLVRLPTTTLGQADSGVGVKNAVNRFGKKNWLGTFAVPWAVINDTTLLQSLPDRDFMAGFAEAVKVSLLKSEIGFDRLYRDAHRIRARETSAAMSAIRASAQLHLDHITRGGDPFEALEARPLDYGHWSAHRLEAVTNFAVRHGEAVSIGVAVDTVYSSIVHGLPQSDADKVLHTLQALGLPLDHPAMHDTDALFAGLEEFRQHLGGRLTLTMLEGVGKPLEVHEVDHAAMTEAIKRVNRFANASPIVGAARAS
ncbi:MAG TPA: 3-dehydroquinate synthase [Burkholderiaceae bacterium]|nr:3-dehydroquinate synthase [Burkholderiaceae bacterium]